MCFGKSLWLKSLFRLSFCLVVCCMLAVAGTTAFLNKPAQACTVIPVAGALPPATECQNYSFNFTATAPGLLCATMCGIITGLPPGLVAACGPLNATSTWYSITGTPQPGTSAGSPYTIIFTDPDGIPHIYQLTVKPCTLSFTTGYLPSAKEGVAYYAVLNVTGGQPPYYYTAIGLPPGLYLSPNGVLQGTPIVGSAGNYSFTVTVTDTCCTTTGYQAIGNLTVAYGTYNVIVSIDNSLKAGMTQVSIDNTPVAQMRGGESQKFEGRLGTSHVVSCTTPVSNPQNADIRFAAENPQQTVSELKPSAYFVFYDEYRILLNSDPAGVAPLSASNWYAKDKTFTASTPAVVDPPGQQGTRYEFKDWLLPNGTTSPNKDLSFIVTGPGSCTARYNTLYALTLISKHGNETTWHQAGDVNWSVTSPKYRMSGIMGVFGGTETAINPSGTAHITGPQEIQINYESHVFLPVFFMFLLAVVVLGGGGWAVYRFAVQPTRAPALPPARAARRLPEEIIEVEGVVVEEERKLPAKRAVKRLPAPAAKRLPAGRGAAVPAKTTKRKPAARKKTSPPSRTRQTRRRSTRRR